MTNSLCKQAAARTLRQSRSLRYLMCIAMVFRNNVTHYSNNEASGVQGNTATAGFVHLKLPVSLMRIEKIS